MMYVTSGSEAPILPSAKKVRIFKMNKIQWFHSYLGLTLSHTGVPGFPWADAPRAVEVWAGMGELEDMHILICS